ncbi:DUF397 domain-containing protein [Streptomyces scopuliridis]|uniref:DUF397 domain-containing protein n=1 Tax=Streptomyces scopuliridis TaxID=452529 RepID=A0ACD4ZK45_9ACTN|nr:DUF397 domain-containing protein [Streptomyces scopuliridis]WSB34626.1 DUF397 domain-containing protein [Streptomyces scopuliridis]WSB98874.1 DUF397 domain-containing protein [Streptomyces scopuliridis]WSC07423.1 DUF397 domain-containing protein [Streptomyces scopuliridis]
MSTTLSLSHAEWVKSTYSNGNGGGCVEWAPAYATASGIVPVRDSKDPEGPTLMLTSAAWSDFVALAASHG